MALCWGPNLVQAVCLLLTLVQLRVPALHLVRQQINTRSSKVLNLSDVSVLLAKSGLGRASLYQTPPMTSGIAGSVPDTLAPCQHQFSQQLHYIPTCCKTGSTETSICRPNDHVRNVEDEDQS